MKSTVSSSLPSNLEPATRSFPSVFEIIWTGLPFLEWTTSEVQRGLARMERLPPGSATELMGVLALCDWAAFARYRPERAEENDAKVRALRFLAAAKSPPLPREGAA